MRHRVKVQTSTDTRNAHGGIDESWATGKTRWCEVVDTRGREFQQSAATQSDMTHLLRMRYTPGITSENRFELDGRTLNILSVVNTGERNKEILVACKEPL